MQQERLLERLRRGDEGPESLQVQSISSVLDHLRRLLNTRQGSVPIADDFGVPDFLAELQSFPDSLHTLESSIRRAIEKFEPRLRDVQVLFQPQQEEGITLRFRILASLHGASRQTICFQSEIGVDGKVLIER